MPAECLQNTYKKHLVLMKVNVSMQIKLIRRRQLHPLRSLKNQVYIGRLPTRICSLQILKGESGMMIIYSMGSFFPEMENLAISRLPNACFAILNIARSIWLIQTCGVIYKIYTTFIRTSPCNFFKKRHQYLCER